MAWSGPGSVLDVCRKCVQVARQVAWEVLESVCGVCGECRQNVKEAQVDAVFEVVGHKELSTNTYEVPCRIVLRRIAKLLRVGLEPMIYGS